MGLEKASCRISYSQSRDGLLEHQGTRKTVVLLGFREFTYSFFVTGLVPDVTRHLGLWDRLLPIPAVSDRWRLGGTYPRGLDEQSSAGTSPVPKNQQVNSETRGEPPSAFALNLLICWYDMLIYNKIKWNYFSYILSYLTTHHQKSSYEIHHN